VAAGRAVGALGAAGVAHPADAPEETAG